MLAFAASAQKNVTQFMGIPIDGTKSAMIQKLKAKGFTYNATYDELSGEFNGSEVKISVVTNNNKVYRIFVTYAIGVSESDIKVNFNRLCRQFQKNGKYLARNLIGMYEIGEEEDISYEMAVNNKRYQASYYQVSESDLDTTGFTQWAEIKLLAKMTLSGKESFTEEEMRNYMIELLLTYYDEKCSHKSVWFMISERYGRYFINIYYDNKNNEANGEDL